MRACVRGGGEGEREEEGENSYGSENSRVRERGGREGEGGRGRVRGWEGAREGRRDEWGGAGREREVY